MSDERYRCSFDGVGDVECSATCAPSSGTASVDVRMFTQVIAADRV